MTEDADVLNVVPSTPEGVVAAVIALLPPSMGRPRVCIDGAAAARPEDVADQIVAALAPRPALHVRADLFWQPASLRLESGRQDPDAWLHRWLDAGALQREVLTSYAEAGCVLPGLRDPQTDRSLRLTPARLPLGAVVLVSGSALLGRGLTFDLSVHIHLTANARARRTPSDDQWTLAALDRYEETVRPDSLADLVVRADDPRHPALVRGGREP